MNDNDQEVNDDDQDDQEVNDDDQYDDRGGNDDEDEESPISPRRIVLRLALESMETHLHLT